MPSSICSTILIQPILHKVAFTQTHISYSHYLWFCQATTPPVMKSTLIWSFTKWYLTFDLSLLIPFPTKIGPLYWLDRGSTVLSAGQLNGFRCCSNPKSSFCPILFNSRQLLQILWKWKFLEHSLPGWIIQVGYIAHVQSGPNGGWSKPNVGPARPNVAPQ